MIRSSLALRTTLQTTLSTRVLPPWPDVRHAFAHSLCVLGTSRNDYSSRREEPHAVFRLLQLKRSSNTLTWAPNPSVGQQSCLLPGDTTPCGVLSAELSQPRGCVVPTLHNCHRSDRSRAGFYPNLISLGHPLSRIDARCLPETGSTVRPCGSGLFRINPPRPTTLARGMPLEPPSRCLREKGNLVSRTQGAFRLRAPSGASSRGSVTCRPGLATGPQAPPVDHVWRGQQPDAFWYQQPPRP